MKLISLLLSSVFAAFPVGATSAEEVVPVDLPDPNRSYISNGNAWFETSCLHYLKGLENSIDGTLYMRRFDGPPMKVAASPYLLGQPGRLWSLRRGGDELVVAISDDERLCTVHTTAANGDEQKSAAEFLPRSRSLSEQAVARMESAAAGSIAFRSKIKGKVVYLGVMPWRKEEGSGGMLYYVSAIPLTPQPGSK